MYCKCNLHYRIELSPDAFSNAFYRSHALHPVALLVADLMREFYQSLAIFEHLQKGLAIWSILQRRLRLDNPDIWIDFSSPDANTFQGAFHKAKTPITLIIDEAQELCNLFESEVKELLSTLRLLREGRNESHGLAGLMLIGTEKLLSALQGGGSVSLFNHACPSLLIICPHLLISCKP